MKFQSLFKLKCSEQEALHKYIRGKDKNQSEIYAENMKNS